MAPRTLPAMNATHLELLASDGWRDVMRELILPFALGETDLGSDVLEVGPGPGVTTDLLRTRVATLTAVEVDDVLAAAITARLVGTNVEVVAADATKMPFPDGRFSGAVSFTMLHHVPTAELQDRLMAEVARVLRPGGVFVASDSIASNELAVLHENDTYNPVEPASVEARLAGAGFEAIAVRSNDFGWAATATATRPAG